MMRSSTSTERATMSPPCQSATRPYGLETEVVAAAWVSIFFPRTKKPRPRGARYLIWLLLHRELDAEHEAVLNRFAVLGGRLVATRAGGGELDRALVQARAAGA